MKFAAGFTLVELMVVIAIMAVIGAYTLSNYRSFGEDQNLKNAVLDIQSQLRAAQTSATANAICNNNQSGATWQLVYNTDKTTVNLYCQESLPIPTPSTCNFSGVECAMPTVCTGDGKTSIGQYDCAIGFTCCKSSISKKTWQLGANIAIQTISGTGIGCPNGVPFTISFAPLSGKIDLGGENCISLSITLINNKTGNTQALNIDQGGRVYGQ